MRVIAGELKGRKLKSPKGLGTRPMLDRVREALFSILGDIEGAAVLDLYAGTGSLGIEALSRGASKAVFVDSGRYATVAANIEMLGLAARAQFIRQDALACLRRQDEVGARWNLIFLDPPYRDAATVAEAVTPYLEAALEPGGRVVWHCQRRSPVPLGLELITERHYGNSTIGVYCKQS